MRAELRKLIAGILIGWAFDICPKGEFKTAFGVFLKNNIMKL